MALYAFDGTWNKADGAERIPILRAQWEDDSHRDWDTTETTVRRMHKALECGDGNSETKPHPASHYRPGVGTRVGWSGKLLGGAAGAGGKRRIREMYATLCREYEDDETIDVVGFSRGAAMAVHFCNVVASRGVCDIANKRRVPRWSRLLGWHRFPAAKKAPTSVPIRFLGIYDMVPSFGLPLGWFRNRSPTWAFRTIPEEVGRSFHALSLDEVRKTFNVIDPTHPKGLDGHYPVWFRGVHANVGGGYDDRGLSDVAFAWMIEMYAWTIAPEVLPVGLQALLDTSEPGADMSQVVSFGLDPLTPDPDGLIGRPISQRRDSWRRIRQQPFVHHSAYRRSPNLAIDFRADNRSLLRPIPRNRIVVNDPPHFHPRSAQEQARRKALTLFYRVPYNPKPWFSTDQNCIFRADSWIGAGLPDSRSGGTARAVQIPKNTFVAICASWILEGEPKEVLPDKIQWTMREFEGANTPFRCMPEMTPLSATAACAFVLAVLNEMTLHGFGVDDLSSGHGSALRAL